MVSIIKAIVCITFIMLTIFPSFHLCPTELILDSYLDSIYIVLKRRVYTTCNIGAEWDEGYQAAGVGG